MSDWTVVPSIITISSLQKKPSTVLVVGLYKYLTVILFLITPSIAKGAKGTGITTLNTLTMKTRPQGIIVSH